MTRLVAFAHALADETRWRIIQLVFDEPMCVCELADILQMPPSSVSSHLQVIKKSGMLDSEKCEKWIYYRLARTHRPLVKAMAQFFETSPASSPVLKIDAKRAVARLAGRHKTCCPPPRALVRRKPLPAKNQTPFSTKQKTA
jgi:ArsR family transcriptional regulator